MVRGHVIGFFVALAYVRLPWLLGACGLGTTVVLGLAVLRFFTSAVLFFLHQFQFHYSMLLLLWCALWWDFISTADLRPLCCLLFFVEVEGLGGGVVFERVCSSGV